MKGTDCTPEQLASAEKFCVDRGWKSRDAVVSFDDCVRLVAWYGALRYMAGRDGTGGTLNEPGQIDDVRPLPPPAKEQK